VLRALPSHLSSFDNPNNIGSAAEFMGVFVMGVMVRSSAVGRGTALGAGRLWDLFQMGFLRFFY
jgi:hypothetical protein